MSKVQWHCEYESCNCHFDTEEECDSHEKKCVKTCSNCGEIHSSVEYVNENNCMSAGYYCDSCFHGIYHIEDE